MLKELRRNYKRIVAFMLTVAMTFTNIGSNLSVAFAAGETEEALFMLNGNDLQSAIQDAVEGGEVFDFNSLELTAKSTSLKNSYQKLLGTKSGDVYALDVEIDDSYAPDCTSMEAFYNAGTEDVVFLFINESDMVVTFRANVDGYETNRVTINPNAANVEDDADAGYVEDYSNTTMVDDTKETLGATVIQTQTGDETAAETEAAESEANETETVADESSAVVEESEDETEAAAETEVAESAEADETVVIENETEAEDDDAAEEAETEASAVEVEEDAADGELVGMSLHPVYRVATTVEILDDDVPLAEETTVETEDEEKSKDETEAEIGEGSEVEIVDETTAAVETVVESAAAETSETESEEAEETAAEETKADAIVIETEAGTEAAEEGSAAAETEATVVVEDNTPCNADRDEAFEDEEGQMLIDDSVENLGDLDGKSYDTVTLWGSANARAYRVAMEDLKGVEAFRSYSVDYSVDPVGAAEIKGSSSIPAGGDLYFGINPQIGYELISVTANGVVLEKIDESSLASASDVAGYEYVYAVEAVDEDLEIVASLKEVSAHPAFEDSVTINGVTITASAEEGIIPEGTVLSAEEVTEQVEAAVKEKIKNENEDKVVNNVIAYDINLMLNGKKLNNTWSVGGDNYVTVTFSGNRIKEFTEQAEEVKVATLETPTKTVEAALGGTEKMAVVDQITADDIEVNDEGRAAIDVSGGTSVREISFEATHFTVYTVYDVMALEDADYTVAVGKTVTIQGSGDKWYNNHSWASLNTTFPIDETIL